MAEEKRVRAIVTPDARKEFCTETKPGVFEIHVKAKAERGEANERVKEVIARSLGVSPKRLRMVTGMRSPRKTFIVE